MRCLTAEQMREVDRSAIQAGTPGYALMGRAAKALASELVFFADEHPRPIFILTGPGNNGGDGFGLAAHLRDCGWPVTLCSAVDRDRVSGVAERYRARAEAAGVSIRWMTAPSDWEGLLLEIPPGAWLVDALLGTGSREAPRGTLAAAVRFVKRAAADHRVWAVDLPSGLHPDTGEPFDPEVCVSADATLTLGAAKTGLARDVAAPWTGSVAVLDIGLDVPEGERVPKWRVVSNTEVRDALPRPKVYDHKGTRGHALFIGGSPGMTGSITLAALAALRCGCGLSTVLAPFTSVSAIDATHQEVMVIPGKQGKFMTLSPQEVIFDPYQVVCMGPGLRVNIDSIEAVRRVLQECPHPLVLDADGLNCMSQIGLRVGDTRRPVYLTPHPGEMARLLDTSRSEVQANRSCCVEAAAEYSRAHVVLKGARSRMVSPLGARWVNLSGNSGLATAGAGDVLAGMVAGLLARGVHRDLALPVAVMLHGRAGELASIRKGVSSVVAGDVLDALPNVLRHAEGR